MKSHVSLVLKSLAKAREMAGPRLGLTQDAPFAKYRFDPIGWARDIRGLEPWEGINGYPGQTDILEAIAEHQKVAILGCNGLGKSVLAGDMAIPWFMTSRTNARVRLSAGTFPQVMQVHRKIRSAAELSAYKWPGKINKSPEWEIGPEWLFDGVSPDDAATMQGLHATGPDIAGGDGGLMAWLDEAGAAQGFKFEAMNSYMTKANSFFVVSGNANSNDWWPDFWAKALHDPSWKCFRIPAQAVPEHIIKPGWIEEQAAYWGEDSSQFKIRVLAEFAGANDEFAVFSMADFESAVERWRPNTWGMSLGVDIARGSADRNAMVLMNNGRVMYADAWFSQDLMAVADRVEDVIHKYNVPGGSVHVDVLGLGAGVVDALRRRGWMVEGVDFSGAVKGDHAEAIGYEQKLENRRAELYWAARNNLRSGVICVPPEWKEIWKEAVRVLYLDKDKIQIEPKERIRKRLKGKSPDYTDALVMALSRTGSPDYVWS